MIYIGTILMKGKDSLLEARNKIHTVAEDLKFDSIGATRIATATSKFCRHMITTGKVSSIKVGLEKKKAALGFVLLFASEQTGIAGGIQGLRTVFDEVEEFQTTDGFNAVRTFKFLTDSQFEPTEEFIEKEKEVIQRLTREELYDQLREAYNNLEQSAAELRESNESLKKEVKKRKQAEERLRLAKVEAETANRAKSEFLTGISHELRTPLNAIIGFSEIIQDRHFGELNQEQEGYIKNIEVSGKHLLSLVNDILDLSKVESGKMELEIGQVNLKDLLDDSMVMIKERAMRHGIRLDIKIADELSLREITADKRMIKQVMFNLLSNAAKFTSDGGQICVTADLIQDSRLKEESTDFKFQLSGLRHGQDWIRISVQDTGIGINPENHEKVFDEFYQVSGELRGKSPGTGLGLPLTMRFVELLGGKIWVESEGEGKGSRFSFVLPLTPSFNVENQRAEKIYRAVDKIVADEMLLNHLNRSISLCKRDGGNFTLCRLYMDIEQLQEKGVNIKDSLEKEKRSYDYLGEDKEGNNYMILQETEQENAKVACERIKKRLERVLEGQKISFSSATFPVEGESAETLLNKVHKE